MAQENLETRLCIWKIDTEMRLASENENMPSQCNSCNEYDANCKTYIDEKFSTLLPKNASTNYLN